MWKSYLKTALRNLQRQKLYACINVLGLAVGLAFCVLVLLFVRDELTYDHFHAKADRIYRLYRDPVQPNSPIDRELAMPIPAGPAMQATFPDVEAFMRIDFDGEATTIRHEGALFEQDGVIAADTSFFQVFSFPLKRGNPSSALADPYSVVLTEPAARTYFGDGDPIGQTLAVRLASEYVDLRVTGVAEAPPSNSSIAFTMVFPYELFVQRYDFMQRAADRWDATRSITYVLLREGADVEHVRAQMPQFMETYLGSIFDEMRAEGTLKTEGPPIVYRLQPLTEIHLNPDVPPGLTPPSDPAYSYILAAIALAVLLIACINFTILALGQSAQRAKEVGVRRALGAQRGHLMVQFWGEVLLLSALALALGLALAETFLPIFNRLAGKALELGAVDWGLALAALLALLFLTGLVAGSYPVLTLARIQPASALRDRVRMGGVNTLTRGLVTAQFVLSVFLLISTLVMAQQLRHMRTSNLGFQGDQVVVIPTRGLEGERVLDRYRALAATQPDIIGVAGANVAIGQGVWRRGFQYEGALKEVVVFRVTPSYLETLQMSLLQGRPFDPQRADDSTGSILVNEAFVRNFGWPEPVGRTLPIDWGGGLKNPTVIGVVQDFHFQSLQNAIEPAVLYTSAIDPVLNVYVRIRPDDVPATLDRLRTTWQTLTQDVPFEYRFLDDSMDQLYQSEERWSQIVGYGALFAVLVACLGLFGMATLTALRRTKEIGIRKVLGASVTHIALLLSKDFARLVLVAIALATPVAYLVMTRWLEGFANRIDLGPWIFVFAGALALVVALATVSYQAIKAALADPVRSLRYE